MSLEAWQIELRRQYGRDQNFSLKNIGEEKIFSEFLVRNPDSGNTYRVAIRGTELGQNYCACPDYATNHLGTCKHLEFTLAQLEKKRGGKKALEEGFHPEYTEVFLQYGAERRVIFRAGTECPPELIELAKKYFDDKGVLQPDSFGKFQTFLSKASQVDHDLRCYDDVLNFVAEVRDDEKRRKHLDDVFPVGAGSGHFKNLLRVPLYPYQREGALFAARAGRCLIGDEMGLGKTIQALAATEIMGQEFGVEQVLIVCPTSLKHQWKREIEKFTRRDATVVEGLRPQRMLAYQEDTFFKIVNYDIVYRDLDFIAKLSPDLVVLDEAQRIKNWDTRTAKSVKQIDTPYAIVLTGTPLENRLEELVSIVQFVDRHRLGPTYRFLHQHQEHDEETGRVIGYKNLNKVGETLKPLLIRRQKKDVLDQLPARLEKNLFVPMTEPQ
ncbi:MAG: DEAD/DEAH box helicase family protein, partial [Planctomycetaceae bacterium]|nr:DEAD/DEAH box helicase family protein [Planctomycetaceae bacterium]